MPCSAFRVAIWKCLELADARWEPFSRDLAVNVTYVSTCVAVRLAVVWLWASALLLLAMVRLSGGPCGKVFELDAPCLSCRTFLVGAVLPGVKVSALETRSIAVAALRLPQMEGLRPCVPP